MKLSKKELLFLVTVTSQMTITGSFDFDNNNDKEFKEAYGLSKDDVDSIAMRLHKEVLTELDKIDMKAIAKNINSKSL